MIGLMYPSSCASKEIIRPPDPAFGTMEQSSRSLKVPSDVVQGRDPMASGLNRPPALSDLSCSWAREACSASRDSTSEKSRASWLTQAIDWAEKGAAGGKFGNVDMAKVAAAGQSCGGVEAYSASVYDPRVKLITSE